jgi:hypothetical protein
MNFWDFKYVFSAPDEVFGPYSTIYFIVVIIGTLLANFFYFYGKYRFKENLLTYTLINRASRNAALVFSLGFFFFLCRIALLQPFNARLFLDITVVLLVYFIVRGIGYLSRTFPRAKAEWKTLQERNARKAKPEATPASIPSAKVARPVAASDGSDETGDDKEEDDSAPAKVRTGLSERGQKRRERKRNKR